MRSVSIIALTTILLLALTLPATALAGGWVVVTLDALPGGSTAGTGPTAGEEMAIGFTVRQHGRTPLPGERPTLTLRHRTTGERVNVTAKEEGPRGHYVARVRLPQPGAWEWAIDVWQQHPMPTLEVRPAAAAAAPATSVLALAGLPPVGATGLTLLAALLLILSWRLRPTPARSSPVS